MAYMSEMLFIDLEKVIDTFDYRIELMNYVYTENVGDVTNAIKTFFVKCTYVVTSFFNDLVNIVKLYKQESYLQKKIEMIEELVAQDPSLGKIKITFSEPHDELGFKEELQIINNWIHEMSIVKDTRTFVLLQKFHMDSDANDKHYTVTVNKALEAAKNFEKEIEQTRDDLKKNLFDIQNRLLKMPEQRGIVEGFKQICKRFKDMILRKVYIMGNNFDVMLYNVKKYAKKIISEGESMVSVQEIKESTLTEIKKGSKKEKTIEINGKKFEVYTTNTRTCCISNELIIYIDKTFYNYPKSYQDAILAHEAGHYFNGHISNVGKIRDSKKDIRYIKTLSKKFDKITNQRWVEYQHGDNELLYLLTEIEADRFASFIAGKAAIKHALTDRFKDSLNFIDEPDISKYNNERMAIRTKLI